MTVLWSSDTLFCSSHRISANYVLFHQSKAKVGCMIIIIFLEFYLCSQTPQSNRLLPKLVRRTNHNIFNLNLKVTKDVFWSSCSIFNLNIRMMINLDVLMICWIYCKFSLANCKDKNLLLYQICQYVVFKEVSNLIFIFRIYLQ